MDAIDLLAPSLPPDLKLIEVLRLLRLRHGRPDVPISPAAAAYVLAARAPDTTESHDGELRRYLRACLDRGRDPFDPDDLAEFCAERCAYDGLAFGSIKQMLSVVGTAAACLGIEPNPARDPWVLETLRGIGRTHGRSPQHVDPLWSNDVRAMAIAARFEPNRNAAVRNMAYVTLMRASGFRRKTGIELQLDQLLGIDERGLEYRPGPTKADQTGQRPTRVIGRTGDPLTCPIVNLEALLEIRGTERPGALLPAMDKQGRVMLEQTPNGLVVAGLTRMQAYNIIVYYCGLIGLPVADFAVHSTRRGLASEGTANGIPEMEMMNELGQASYDTFAEYVTTRRERAYAIAKRSGL